MALIKCSNCGEEISSKAKKCPKCNEKIQKNYKKSNVAKTGVIITIIGSALLIGSLIFMYISYFDPNDSSFANRIIPLIILSVITILLGCLYLKNFNMNTIIYGIVILILSIISFVSLYMLTETCCELCLLIIPVLNFIGSILIMVGAIGNNDNT